MHQIYRRYSEAVNDRFWIHTSAFKDGVLGVCDNPDHLDSDRFKVYWLKNLESPRCEPIACFTELEDAVTKINNPALHFEFNRGFLMPDVQRQAVYSWEDKNFVWDDELVEGPELQRLFDEVVDAFQLPESDCKLTFETKGTQSLQRGYTIRLVPTQMKPSILMHELAHVLMYNMFLHDDMDPLEGHGPEWLTCYINLLVDFLDYEHTALIASAKIYGLRFHEESIKTRYKRPTSVAKSAVERVLVA